jgi:LysM repeat protein
MPIYPETQVKVAQRTAGIIAALSSLSFVSAQRIESAIIKTAEDPVIHALKELESHHLRALGGQVYRLAAAGDDNGGPVVQWWHPHRHFRAGPTTIPPPETYQVQPGDSFWSIAHQDHVSMAAIAAYNHMGLGDVLPVNKVLHLPPAAWIAAHGSSRHSADPQLEPITNSEPDSALWVWLKELRDCESGGNYAEDTGNGFYGAYQFTQSTWDHWHTGYARADLAPPSVQDATIVKNTLATSGLSSQNPGCYESLGISNYPP